MMSSFRGLFAGLMLIAILVMPSPAAADFNQWVREFWPTARANGISEQTFNRAFANVAPDPSVIKAASHQAEFVKPIWEYLDSAVSDKRVANGRRMKAQHSRVLDAVEAKYGVDRHVLLAIWGMESSYGAVLDNPRIVKSVIRSLATLAYQGGRRSRFGREQLIAALKILERGDITPERMTGSWAGAMGHTQFIPTTFNAYAVDFDGDGRRDIWSNVADALGSTAHYLRRSGWEPGKTWGYEVVLPEGFNYALADRKTRRSLAEWSKFGIKRTRNRDFPRLDDQAMLIVPAGANGPAFLMLKNFNAILRYNNATSYAIGVGHLADRIRGGSGFAQSWPRGDTPLTRTQRRELQQVLTSRGFSLGDIDGKIGPKTQAAIRAFQKSQGLIPDGYASLMLLQRLQSGS